MAKRLQHRGGTTSQHSTFTGAVREVTVDTDKNTLVVHDGATAGGHPLATATNFTSTGIDDNATSTAITINSGENVGIGTVSPNAILDVEGANINFASSENGILNVFSNDATAVNKGGSISLGGNSESGSLGFAMIKGAKQSTDAGYLAFGTRSAVANSTERMRIDSSGRVGIGTSSPSQPLDVVGNAEINGDLIVKRTGNNLGNITPLEILTTDSGGAAETRIGLGRFSFGYGAVIAAYHNYAGSSAAGFKFYTTTHPNTTPTNLALTLAGTNAYFSNGNAYFSDGTESSPSIANSGDSNTGIFFPASDTIGFSTNGSERMRIDSFSNIIFRKDGFAESMRIDSSGNLLINTTTSPSTQTNSLVIGNNTNDPNSGGIFGQQIINKSFRTSNNDITNLDITLTASSVLIGCFTVSVFGGYGTSNKEGYAEYRVYCNRQTNSITTITVQSPVNKNGSFTSGYSFSATKPSLDSIKFAITKPTGAHYYMIISGELADNRFTGLTRSQS